MSAILTRNNVHVVGEGKTTLVLAHGFGTDQTAWRHQRDALATRYRLVLRSASESARGHGERLCRPILPPFEGRPSLNSFTLSHPIFEQTPPNSSDCSGIAGWQHVLF